MSYQTFQKTSDCRDIVPGDIVWKVDGKVLFRGVRYSGTFEVNAVAWKFDPTFRDSMGLKEPMSFSSMALEIDSLSKPKVKALINLNCSAKLLPGWHWLPARFDS